MTFSDPFVTAYNDYDHKLQRLNHMATLTMMLALKRVYVTGENEDSSIIFITPPLSQTMATSLMIKDNTYKTQLEAKLPTYIKEWRSTIVGHARM